MTPTAVKWALFDLLRSLDALHGGQYHEGFQRIAQGLGYGCTKNWRTRAMNDAAKWAVFDLLKALDVIFTGRHHEKFARITEGLGLELPVVAPPPDPAPDSEDEAAGEQESEQDRIYQFLLAQTEPVSLARIITELGLKRWTATGTLNRLQRKGRIEHPGHDAWQIRKPAPGGSGSTD
jgi:hypothetical protein